MSTLQVVTGHYTDDGMIRLYTRGEDRQRRVIDVFGFEPYSAVRIDDTVPAHPGIVAIDQDVHPALDGPTGMTYAAKKLVFSSPNMVPRVRGSFHNRYEDNVRFVRRLLIDCGIKSGIEDPGQSVVGYEELVPVDTFVPPLKVFWDIECYSKFRIPDPQHPDQKITGVTFYDDIDRHYYSILTADKRSRVKMDHDWTLFKADGEEDALQTCVKYLEKVQGDVLAEWGRLDKSYFPPRAEMHGVDVSVFDTMCCFDLIPGYKKLFQRGSNRLKDVAFDEKIIDYLPKEHKFAWLYDNDPLALMQKNKHDVEWIVKLDQIKGGLVDFFWNLKNASGLEDLQETTFHGMLVDTRLLRQYHGKYFLQSRGYDDGDNERWIGALVKKPPKALVPDSSVVDFSRYYPNLMIGRLTALGEDWMKPLVELCIDLQAERDLYDEALRRLEIDTPEYKVMKGKRDSVKYIGEAVIGYLGSTKSRIKNRFLFENVTVPGREGLLFAESICEREGHRVDYYDTDGLTTRCTLKQVDPLIEILNGEMEGWCERNQLTRPLKLKLDRFFSWIVYTGVKKRYAGWVTFEDGKPCDYLHIKGFEYVRRSSSLVTREVQREVFEHLLRRGIPGLREYLTKVVGVLRKGDRPIREIALNKNIKKKFEDYDPVPLQVRGALWANRYMDAQIVPGDQVYYVYVKRVPPGMRATDVISFLDEDTIPKGVVIDWQKMIEKTVKDKVEELISQGGLSWGKVMGMRSMR